MLGARFQSLLHRKLPYFNKLAGKCNRSYAVSIGSISLREVLLRCCNYFGFGWIYHCMAPVVGTGGQIAIGSWKTSTFSSWSLWFFIERAFGLNNTDLVAIKQDDHTN